jgi:hypothetical protein
MSTPQYPTQPAQTGPYQPLLDQAAPAQPPAGQPPAKPKKPIWRAKWFWALVVIVVIIIIIVSANSGGGSSKGTTTPTQTASTSQSQSSAAASTSAPASSAPASSAPARDNSSAKLTTLGAGTFSVGTDIPAGRYVATPAKTGDSGNLTVNSADGSLDVNEILGDVGSGMDMGVPSCTFDLSAGDSIQIQNLSGVKFTPAVTAPFTGTLTAGDWQVGIDIPAGRYVVTPATGRSGNFFVYDTSGFATTNEILGGSDSGGVPSVTVTLTAGQTVSVSGLPSVTFKKA